MKNLLAKYKQWKNKRYWKKQQLEYLRVTLLQDHRWLANDKTADALTSRYLSILSEDWYKLEHEDVSKLRDRLGLNPFINKQKRPALAGFLTLTQRRLMDISNAAEITQFIYTETNIATLKQLYAICYNSGMEDKSRLIWKRIRELKGSINVK